MKELNYRLGKNDKERYGSFEEMREAWNLKPVTKRTSDKKKLDTQREKFVGTCRCCGQPMKYISGTNVLVCSNEDCRGRKIEKTNDDGTKYVIYIPIIRVLDDKGFEISQNLFD